ncbi:MULTISPECIES: hypothetical protein [unclassified Roseateles]|uniref:hypothetical protein n=1 Tax=unclassified Roseateles TaxID=2626991 RepID=UPI0006F958C1|nr:MULTISPECIES: hypothetical protein [unclassified Roseateles]KQW51235.1 hypothetical protein ASC81_00870 [Pelomonas sp. Root405]KRA77467.1 hypothetical protein ASD88_00870 [Pelomonas sp. Root662]
MRNADDAGIAFDNERGALPPEEDPCEVHSWRLLKAPSGELHLGTRRDRKTNRAVVRLTSALAGFDITSRAVKTTSRHRCMLMAPPKSRPLECMAIRNGAALLGLSGGIDISSQFWAQLHPADSLHPAPGPTSPTKHQ